MNPDYNVLRDGCDGDSEGLATALGDGFSVIYSNCDDYGYGHHSYDELFVTARGHWIHAECGGCSCRGSGTWSYCEDEKEALTRPPDDARRAYLAERVNK